MESRTDLTHHKPKNQVSEEANPIDLASDKNITLGHRPTTHDPAIHIRGLSRLDLNVPLFSYLPAPGDTFQICPSIKAIILDFDGTTMKFDYTEGMRQKAYRRAIQSIAIETLGRKLSRTEIIACHNPAINRPEEEMAEVIATGLSGILGKTVHGADLFGRWLEQCEYLLIHHQQRYGRSPHSAIVKGMRDLLDGANARNIPVSICTAGAHQFVEPLLKAGGLTKYLHHAGNVFVNRHPDIRSKPHADPYLLVCRKLDLEPSQILVAEDSATGALAALRAGARVIFQPSGNREQTLRNLLWQVKQEHSEWIHGRPGAVTVLSRDQGWNQVKFPSSQMTPSAP
jgi:beta-phosphoglucomutase-like phosphatase (HAD superfamily)